MGEAAPLAFECLSITPEDSIDQWITLLVYTKQPSDAGVDCSFHGSPHSKSRESDSSPSDQQVERLFC